MLLIQYKLIKKVDYKNWFKRLIQKVDYKGWLKKLSSSGNR